MNEIPTIPEKSSVPPVQDVLLTEILSNQQKILENQNILLRAERSRRLWAIIKIVIIALLVLVPLFLLPAMLSSMMGGLNLDAILGNPDMLEQLLMGQ